MTAHVDALREILLPKLDGVEKVRRLVHGPLPGP